MNARTRNNAAPVIHWAAISSGALIGLAVSFVADALWSAAAFSSHNSAFYNHLAWWYGATLIAATLIGAASSAALSQARGVIPGAANGLTTWALVLLATGAIAVVVAVTNGATSTLTIGSSTLQVSLGRPYVAFWASLAALAAGFVGGAAGGLVPRRDAASPSMTLGNARPAGLEAPTNGTSARRPSGVVAG
jgi:hypothetical protein